MPSDDRCLACGSPFAFATDPKVKASERIAFKYCPTCSGPPAFGGAAPSAPTTDAHMIHGLERCIAAAHRLLDEHHDATVADRQDAEDAARLLAVLRGGATAPTPDDPTMRRMRTRQGSDRATVSCAACPKTCVATATAYVLRLRIRVRRNATRRRTCSTVLRRDTGASHE
jgi:hypothetical protein